MQERRTAQLVTAQRLGLQLRLRHAHLRHHEKRPLTEPLWSLPPTSRHLHPVLWIQRHIRHLPLPALMTSLHLLLVHMSPWLSLWMTSSEHTPR